jgi:hypothetical protein
MKLMLLMFLVAGSLWAEPDEPWLYRPTNIYQLEEKLPVTLRRVAVLPVTVAGDDAVAEHGRATQEAMLRQELGK